MVDAIHEGKLKSMYLKGEDMITSDSNANYVGAGLEMLEFFVVQDISLSETARFADVVLPASPSLEKEGTFTSTERRIQRLLPRHGAARREQAGLGDHFATWRTRWAPNGNTSIPPRSWPRPLP